MMVNRRWCRIWKGQFGRSVILLLAFCCVYGARTRNSTDFYFHKLRLDDTYFSTGRCSEPWCGEQWRENRILYYNNTIQWRRENVSRITINQNCSGGVHVDNSLLCRESSSQEKKVESRNCSEVSSSPECQDFSQERIVESRDVFYLNRTLVKIVTLPNSSIGFITTNKTDVHGNFTGSSTYPANQDKIWQIKVPQGCRLLLYFSDFDIEQSPNCQKDNFSVQTKRRERNFHIYCNTGLKMIEIRNRRKVQLWLHSNEIMEGSGILASFCFNPEYGEENNQPCGCNAEVIDRGENRSTETSVSGKSYSRRELDELRKRAREEDELIGMWLVLMMQNPTVIEEYLNNTANPKQQSLARKYQEALRAYSQDV